MSTIRYARRGKREEEEEEEEEGEKMATHSTTSPPEMVGINHVKTERERERRERETSCVGVDFSSFSRRYSVYQKK